MTVIMTVSSTLLAVNNSMAISGATTMNSILNVVGNINTSGLTVININ